jgi:Peptidase family M23
MPLLAFALNLLAAADPAAAVTVTVKPEHPIIETRGSMRYLNCDFLLQNRGGQALRLEEVQVSVLDRGGRLVLRRFISGNGTSPSIETVGKRDLEPGATKLVFNPFHTFEPDTPLDKLRYEFLLLGREDEKMQVRLEATLTPRSWQPKTDLVLPLKGRTIVWDGHDFYSHHRRWDVTHPILQKIGMRNNPDRYAYDFSIVDEQGRMYRGDGEAPEEWLGWGVPVLAPGAGRVVESANDARDHGPDRVNFETALKTPRLTCGNYVVIDHGNGEFSVICHMKQGSVRVKPGDPVRQGEQLGQMGFSGDAITVHVHYQLQDRGEFDGEGLPSYFSRFRRRLGGRSLDVSKGQIDSGDIVEAR